MFEEKRGNAALLFKHSGFYFIFDPKKNHRGTESTEGTEEFLRIERETLSKYQ